MKKSYIYSVLAALFLAAVALFFFFPDDVQGNVLQQADTLQGLANGQEGKAFTEATGETTRWTNSLFGGMPNFQIAPSYPANEALSWISQLYMLWLPSPANLLFAMMLGFFIMMLCMKQKWYVSLFGAVAWGLSTYFVILIGAGHIWKFVTLAYIPPTIGGLVLLYRGKYVSGTALTALFGALQLQSNHPQMTYYFLFVIFFMVLAWLWEAIKEKKMRRWTTATLCALGGALLAVAANAPSLYNSYEYSKETVRGRATELTPKDGSKETGGMSRDAITAWSYGVDETLTLLVPNVKGGATIKPVGGQNELLRLTDVEKINDLPVSPEEYNFIGQFPQYFGDQPMTNGPVYVGAFVLVLAILALFICEGPMKWALFAVSVLAILLSWGHNFPAFTNFFIDYFPGYNRFRAVSSILVIVEFTLPLLAAMALVKIFKTENFKERYGTTFLCISGVCALICLLGWIWPSMFGSPFSYSETEQLREMGLFSDPRYANIINAIRETRLSLVSNDSFRSLMFILLGTAITWAYIAGWLKNKVATACMLTAVVLIDLFTVNQRYVNSDNFTEPVETENQFHKTAADEAILQDKSNYRVMDVSGFSGARSSYFHKTIGGYHAAKLTRYNDLIERQIRKNNMEVLNMLNTKYFLDGNQYEVNPDANGNAWFVEGVTYVAGADAEMATLDTLKTKHFAVADKKFEATLGKASKTEGDTIVETSYAPNRLTYKAKSAKGGVAVFSEIYFPWGWNATIDGKPVELGRVNYVLRALNVPAGEHQIEMTFDPKSSKVTNAMSIASIVVIYLLLIGALALLWRHISKIKNSQIKS